jgi:Eukaryotic aspartyl protease
MATSKYARALLAVSTLMACIQAAPVTLSAKRTAEPKTIRMPISKQARDISKRQAPVASLENEVFKYFIQVQVGTPPQAMSLELDTGSSDTWVFSDSGCSDVGCDQGSCECS